MVSYTDRLVTLSVMVIINDRPFVMRAREQLVCYDGLLLMNGLLF